MSKTKYRRSSPYFETDQTSLYLDVYSDREIPSLDDDDSVTISARYENRPDLLSYDLYGTPDYWWVFIRRNMDLIKDPVYGMTAGLTIRVPSRSFIDSLSG